MELGTLIARIEAAGVVGAGGAGFPTHVKLNNRCETVIVNAAECEPLLQVDQQLLRTEAQVLAGALADIVEGTGAKRGVFAVKAKYESARMALQEVLKNRPCLEIFLLQDFYPAGDEQVLVYEVLGKTVPPGGIPIQVGAIVLNVETLLNVAKAIAGEPVVRKYITVAGAVSQPLTVCVPVGTSIREVLELAGGPSIREYRVLEGGPMMGKEVPDMDRGITKTTKGLIVLPSEHRLWRNKEVPTGILLKRAMAVCCQCSACTDLCPRYLLGHGIEPHRILRNTVHNVSSDITGMIGAQFCSECGACDYYACVMDISPRLINVAVKRELAKQGYKAPLSSPSQVHPDREGRKIPLKRLVSRLGLAPYHKIAPLVQEKIEINTVVLELKQHLGATCQPVVEAGARVEVGQVVAEVPSGQLGSKIHASIAGTVTRVLPQIVITR